MQRHRGERRDGGHDYDLYSAPEYATQATELVAQIPARTSNRWHYSFW